MISKTIRIEGLSKIGLLKVMWRRATNGIYGSTTQWNNVKLEKLIKSGFIGQYMGGVINTDLSGEFVDPSGYDKMHFTGKPTLKMIVESFYEDLRGEKGWAMCKETRQ